MLTDDPFEVFYRPRAGCLWLLVGVIVVLFVFGMIARPEYDKCSQYKNVPFQNVPAECVKYYAR